MRIHPAIKLFSLALILPTFLAMPAHAQNFERGQELFEHQCHGCHSDLNRAGQVKKVKSPAGLRKKISSWAAHTGADWGKSEIDDVLYYMEKSFYRLPEKRR